MNSSWLLNLVISPSRVYKCFSLGGQPASNGDPPVQSGSGGTRLKKTGSFELSKLNFGLLKQASFLSWTSAATER